MVRAWDLAPQWTDPALTPETETGCNGPSGGSSLERDAELKIFLGKHREPFKWYMRPGNRREIYRHFMKTQIENDESRCNQWSCTINVKEMDVDVACVVTSSLPALPLAESKSLLHVACDQCSRPSVILWLNTGWWIGIPNDSHNGLWSI